MQDPSVRFRFTSTCVIVGFPVLSGACRSTNDRILTYRVIICRVNPSKWFFEETFTFMEVTGAFVFWLYRKKIHEGILKMWGHLRRFVLYFLQYRPGQHSEWQVRQAQSKLIKYAQLAVKYKLGKLCTLLLHRACFHIPEQVLAGLPGAWTREDFGERCIRFTKRYITNHATKEAARASAQCLLDEMVLRVTRVEKPHSTALYDAGHTVSRVIQSDYGDGCGIRLHAVKQFKSSTDPVSTLYTPPRSLLFVRYHWSSVLFTT